ncbi:MAG TPA: 50S ribosomal protein L10 [Candidatus Paceibacterota bacterium]|nr:50S ribosomal protein L10 [Candidatus Paceibacterota bacterium]
MAITKAKKKEIVEKVEKGLKGAQSVVFVNFKGIKVNEMNKFRKALREQGVGYTVAKKTLISRALEAVKYSGTQPDLGTELAVAFSQDNLAAHREINDFAKKNKEQMKIMGGVFEGAYVDAMKVVSLASIPSQKTLYAQFVNVINSPIQGLAVALSEIAKAKPQA